MFVGFFFFLCWRVTLSSSVDYFNIVEDYSRNVKEFNAITVLSCPTRFNIEGWITAHPFADYLFQFVDITERLNLTIMENEPNCRQLVFLDLSCPDANRIILQLSDEGQFNTLCRAFLFINTFGDDEYWYENELKPVLSTTDFTFISNVVYGSKSPIHGQVEDALGIDIAQLFLYDVWNPGRTHGGTLKMDLIGIYKKEESGVIRFHRVDDAIMVHRRLNLSELQLQCTIVVTSPFNDTLESYITHNYDPYLDTVHRLNFRTMGLVQDYYNFKLRVKRAHSWGYVQNASSAYTFDGMVGMVQRGEVDFGCSPAWFRLERLQVVDYGAQTWAIRPIFLFRHPNTRGLGKNVFLEPFEDAVWVVLLASSGIIIVLMANAIQQDKRVLGQTDTERVEEQTGCVRRTFDSVLLSVHHVVRSFVQSTRIYISVILQQGELIVNLFLQIIIKLSSFQAFQQPMKDICCRQSLQFSCSLSTPFCYFNSIQRALWDPC